MDKITVTASRERSAAGKVLLPLIWFVAASQGAEATDSGGGAILDTVGLRCGPALLAVTSGGSRAMTVTVDAAPAVDLTVNLLADNPSIASVPPTATIPAGQTFALAMVTGGTQGATFITARVDTERAGCSVYVADRLSGSVFRLPTPSVLVAIGTPNDRPEPPKLALPIQVMILPIPFGVTQPARIDIQPTSPLETEHSDP